MVGQGLRKALEQLWTDRCTVYVLEKARNPESKLTEFEEVAVLEDIPCRLSFSQLSAASGDAFATTSQTVKLFLAPETEIPPGSKLSVRRPGRMEPLLYSQSGEPSRYASHQEIPLTAFGRWA